MLGEVAVARSREAEEDGKRFEKYERPLGVLNGATL